MTVLDTDENEGADEGLNRLRVRLGERLAGPPEPLSETGEPESDPDVSRRFLAGWLEQYRSAQRLSREDLAGRLGTDVAGLSQLALCLAPREDHFNGDVAELAAYTGCDTGTLRSLLRQRQVLFTFVEEVGPEWQTVTTARPVGLPNGLLLAARDREEDEDETQKVGGENGEG